VNQLHAVLQLGESEAIVLAKELQADLLILDEEKGRELAEGEGLRVAGILALIMRAKEKGWMPRSNLSSMPFGAMVFSSARCYITISSKERVRKCLRKTPRCGSDPPVSP